MQAAPSSPSCPYPIAPMKGVAGDLPSGIGWVHELKWDGMRVVAHIADGVRLQSSNGNDVTTSYPELAGLVEVAAGVDDLVLDGEVVAFDGDQPSFGALQKRMHVRDRVDAARRSRETPVLFVVFDLLWLDGNSTMALPLHGRRSLLETLMESGQHWTVSDQHHDDPAALLEVVTAAGLEGIVSKRADSVYEPGRRSPNWVKVKPRRRQEFVVAGWISGRGSRSGQLGSLVVGYYDGDDFLFAGSAGSGLTEADLGEWLDLLSPTAACPFSEPPEIGLQGRSVQWCVPDQVVEIAFGEWPEGQHLRHPVVLGRRTDKPPRSVTRE